MLRGVGQDQERVKSGRIGSKEAPKQEQWKEDKP
jgi:hypothetical protein